jgi:hypothetical protein
MICGLILFLFLRSFGVCWWAGKQHVQRKVSGAGRRGLPLVHLLLPYPTASLRPSPVLQEVPQRRVKPTHGGVATNWRQRILLVWDRLWRARTLRLPDRRGRLIRVCNPISASLPCRQ